MNTVILLLYNHRSCLRFTWGPVSRFINCFDFCLCRQHCKSNEEFQTIWESFLCTSNLNRAAQRSFMKVRLFGNLICVYQLINVLNHETFRTSVTLSSKKVLLRIVVLFEVLYSDWVVDIHTSTYDSTFQKIARWIRQVFLTDFFFNKSIQAAPTVRRGQTGY